MSQRSKLLQLGNCEPLKELVDEGSIGKKNCTCCSVGTYLDATVHLHQNSGRTNKIKRTGYYDDLANQIHDIAE